MSTTKSVAGRWHDEQGSEVTFEVGDGGALSGRFRPGGAAGEQDYPLCGYVKKNLVAFVVAFDRHGTLASWTGHVVEDEDEPALTTLWHMTLLTPHPTRAEDRWRGIWAGANTFRRGRARRGVSNPLPLWPA
jgi:hypothetical protein